jgi:hypothetical protein
MNARKILTMMAANALEESGHARLADELRLADIPICDGGGFKLMVTTRENGETVTQLSQQLQEFDQSVVERFLAHRPFVATLGDRLSIVFELPLTLTTRKETVTVTEAALPFSE